MVINSALRINKIKLVNQWLRKHIPWIKKMEQVIQIPNLAYANATLLNPTKRWRERERAHSKQMQCAPHVPFQSTASPPQYLTQNPIHSNTYPSILLNSDLISLLSTIMYVLVLDSITSTVDSRSYCSSLVSPNDFRQRPPIIGLRVPRTQNHLTSGPH